MDTILGLKPTEFTFTALAFMLTSSLIFFSSRQWWPWYTKQRWPAIQEAKKLKEEREFSLKKNRDDAEIALDVERQKQAFVVQQENLKVQQDIRDVLVELRTLVSQNALSIGRVERAVSDGMETRLQSIEEAIIKGKA